MTRALLIPAAMIASLAALAPAASDLPVEGATPVTPRQVYLSEIGQFTQADAPLRWAGRTTTGPVTLVETARTPLYVELFDPTRGVRYRLFADRVEVMTLAGRPVTPPNGAGVWAR